LFSDIHFRLFSGFAAKNQKTGSKRASLFTLVRSIVESGCTVWDPYLQKDIHILEKTQRKAARFVKDDYNSNNSVTHMVKELGCSNLEEKRKIHQIAVPSRKC